MRKIILDIKDSGYIMWLCPCCNKPVDTEKDLFVEENDILYHFSCYNYKKAEEEKK